MTVHSKTGSFKGWLNWKGAFKVGPNPMRRVSSLEEKIWTQKRDATDVEATKHRPREDTEEAPHLQANEWNSRRMKTLFLTSYSQDCEGKINYTV